MLPHSPQIRPLCLHCPRSQPFSVEPSPDEAGAVYVSCGWPISQQGEEEAEPVS